MGGTQQFGQQIGVVWIFFQFHYTPVEQIQVFSRLLHERAHKRTAVGRRRGCLWSIFGRFGDGLRGGLGIGFQAFQGETEVAHILVLLPALGDGLNAAADPVERHKEQISDLGAHLHPTVADAFQYVFHGVGDLVDIQELEHPRRALEGVGGTQQFGQQIGVVWIFLQFHYTPVEQIQVFPRLLHECVHKRTAVELRHTVTRHSSYGSRILSENGCSSGR